MKKRNKIISIAILAAILAQTAGCSGNGSGDVGSSDSSLEKGEVSYPIQTDQKLTYWVTLPSALTTVVSNFGETEFAKEYSKRTGIEVEYSHPAQGQEANNLSLLIASDDLPDIIETDWLSRNPAESIQLNTITELNSLIDDYSPNLKKFLADNPDINRAVKTDSNQYYVYPFVRGDGSSESLTNTSGFMIRQDWLDKLGVERPETIAEWENVLTLFKDKMGATEPLTVVAYELSFIAGAFGAPNGFYVDNGKVKYGPMESNFKTFLETAARWYKNGLLDKNFAVLDEKQKQSNFLSGKTGIVFGSGGSGIGVYVAGLHENNPSSNVTAIRYPVENKGDIPKFTNETTLYTTAGSAAISGKSKNKELAARFLDYSYSEDGYMLNNFGIEGVSYEMKDGYPTYTDNIFNNPSGLSIAQAMHKYIRACNVGPFVQDKRYIEQYYRLDQQREALDVWGVSDTDKYCLPQVTLTKEESSEYTKIMGDLDVYKDETMLKFIVGNKSIEEFDSYVEEIKRLKIDRAIEIQQAAYDRFIQRK